LLPNLTPAGFAALGKKNMEEFAKVRSELLSAMQEAHRHWFDRMQSEAKLASEFANRATNCRSIPDAVAACQEWTGRRFEMMADDGKHLITDSRKAMERGARFLSDGLFAHGQTGVSAEAAEDRQASSAEAAEVHHVSSTEAAEDRHVSSAEAAEVHHVSSTEAAEDRHVSSAEAAEHRHVSSAEAAEHRQVSGIEEVRE
jgi:hypothetical protein